MKTYLSLLLIGLIIICIYSCKDDPISPPPPADQPKKDTIDISIQDFTHRSVTINIKTTNHNPPRFVNVYRITGPYQNLIARYSSAVSDTSIIDDNNGIGLGYHSTYKWYAATSDSIGNLKDTSITVETRTLDTTSHDYTWELISVGGFSSTLEGIWGSGDNDIWAIGGMSIDSKYYGGMHWDGYQWTFDSTGGGSEAFGFGSNNIWVCGGSVFNYDGIKWKRLDYFYGIGLMISLWGSSNYDMYFGTELGKVYHWDGYQRTEVLSDTNHQITDIAGCSPTEVYALASFTSYNVQDRIYLFNGSEWRVLKETGIAGPPGNVQRPLNSIWVKNRNELFVAGRSIYRKINESWQLQNFWPETQISKIRGTNTNNVVAMGNSGYIYHYNGSTWKLIHTPESSYMLNGLFVTENKIYCVGRDAFNAKILIGTKQ